jgi:hypothetical protein
MTRIERFASRADAELARTVLETNGIPAYVSGDDAGGLHPEIPYGIGGTAVVVPEDRYAEAIALLDEELGDQGLDAADLEAAALAAGPATGTAGEPAGAGRSGHPGATTGPPATRRSGGRRPLFLGVLALMGLAMLVYGGYTLITVLWQP